MLRVLGERARPSLENWFGRITLVIWKREARRLKRWTRKVREDCGDFGYHWEEGYYHFQETKTKAGETQWLKAPANRIEEPEIWVQSLEPGWWKERADFCKLSTAPHSVNRK